MGIGVGYNSPAPAHHKKKNNRQFVIGAGAKAGGLLKSSPLQLNEIKRSEKSPKSVRQVKLKKPIIIRTNFFKKSSQPFANSARTDVVNLRHVGRLNIIKYK